MFVWCRIVELRVEQGQDGVRAKKLLRTPLRWLLLFAINKLCRPATRVGQEEIDSVKIESMTLLREDGEVVGDIVGQES